MSARARRESITYRGASGAYYGFTVFGLDETLPRAAGVYALATPTLGPERWQILLIGETSNFSSRISTHNGRTQAEARRRGASHVLLYVSPIATDRRREAAQDLWRSIRSPLVAWDMEDARRQA